MNTQATTSAGRTLTVDEVLALPVAVDLVTAGRAWGFGRTKSHELARAGAFPCPVLRIGNAYRVTRADLLRSLGIDPAHAKAGPATDPALDLSTAPNATMKADSR